MRAIFRLQTSLLNVLATSALILANFASATLADPPLALTTPPVPASFSAPPASSSLEQDARLKHLVTIRAVGVTLDDLLHKLSTNGLLLLADNSSGPQKLQIRLNRKPLSTLMQSLAQLLPGSWLPRGDGSGYFFVMSKNAVARRDRWWELFLKEQERAREAQRKFILAKMCGQPVLHKIYHDSTNPENENKADEARDLSRQEFFGILPPALQERIADQMVDRDFNAGFHVGGGIEEGAIVIPLRQLPALDQNLVLNECASFFSVGHNDPANVLVRFNNFGFEVALSLLAFKGMGVPLGTSDTHINLGVDLCPDACTLPLYHAKLVDIVRKLGVKAPDAWQELAEYQKSRIWSNVPPHTPSSAAFPPPRRYRADVLDWLADHAGIDFVADYYTSLQRRPMSTEEKAQLFTGEIKEELNVVAKDQDISWRRAKEGIYLFRNNRWYRDDRLEIPSSLIQRWLVQMEALQAPLAPRPNGSQVLDNPVHFKACLDWEADIVSNLADWQIPTSFCWTAIERVMPSPAANQTSGAVPPVAPTQAASSKAASVTKEVVFPFFAVAELLQSELVTLRFYEGLDEEQREALLAGRLPLTALSPAQQQQVRYLAPTQSYLAGNRAIWLGAQPEQQGFVLPPEALPLPLPWCSLRLTAVPAQ